MVFTLEEIKKYLQSQKSIDDAIRTETLKEEAVFIAVSNFAKNLKSN